jgi:hypothetical protein
MHTIIASIEGSWMRGPGAQCMPAAAPTAPPTRHVYRSVWRPGCCCRGWARPHQSSFAAPLAAPRWVGAGGWGGGGSGDALSSYELGSGTISAADALGSLLPQATEGGRGGDRAAAAAATAEAAEAAAAGARADIVKLQEMLLLFNERLLQVEAAHR